MKGIQMVDPPLLRDLLRTREFLVINHTDCGMLTFKDKDLQDKLTKKTGVNAAKVNFHAFGDLEENVRTQVERIRTNPFLPKDIPVTGFVYDVRSGKLNRVTWDRRPRRARRRRG